MLPGRPGPRGEDLPLRSKQEVVDERQQVQQHEQGQRVTSRGSSAARPGGPSEPKAGTRDKDSTWPFKERLDPRPTEKQGAGRLGEGARHPKAAARLKDTKGSRGKLVFEKNPTRGGA